MAKLVWQCPMTGTLYAADDPRLVGTGNPPSVPMEEGQGCCQLVPRMVPDGETVDKSEDTTFRSDYVARARALTQ